MSLCIVWHELINRPTADSCTSPPIRDLQFGIYLKHRYSLHILLYSIEREASFQAIWRSHHYHDEKSSVLYTVIEAFASIHTKQYSSGNSLIVTGNEISSDRPATCFHLERSFLRYMGDFYANTGQKKIIRLI